MANSGGAGIEPPGGFSVPSTPPPIPPGPAVNGTPTPWEGSPGLDRYGSNVNPGIQTWLGPSGKPLDRLPDTRADDNQNGNATALLVNGKNQSVALWLTDFITSFELTGITAQSRGYRQFFPRAFNQPSYTLRGNVANDYQFNRLAEFVHMSQLDYLQSETTLYSTPPLTLYVKGNYGQKTQFSNETATNRNHIGWVLFGYVEKIIAGAVKFNPAPAFEFEFVSLYNDATNQDLALYTDDQVTARSKTIVSWMDIIKSDAFTVGKAVSTVPGTGALVTEQGVSDLGNAINTGIGDIIGNLPF